MDIYWVHSIGSSIWEEMIKSWVMTTRKDFGNTEGQIERDICGNIYLLKVSFNSIFFITFVFSIEPYYLTILH